MRQTSDSSTDNTAKSRLSVLITGDLSFGENYQAREEERGRENFLKSRGYAYTMERLSGLLLQSDLVLSNLETTVTDRIISPFAKSKDYIHWSDIRETPRQLLAHNIKTVSLANNHSIDFGEAGLLQTLQVLERAGIQTIGAGKNLKEAQKPFDYESDLISAGGSNRHLKIKVFSAFAVDEKYKTEFKAYAELAKPGTNPLHVDELANEIAAIKQNEPDTFVIALLHWRRDYKWRSKSQADAARAIMEAGADVLAGHGAHMLQEIEKVANRWVCHGLGNFVLNSPGRYEQIDAVPFSLVARLIFTAESSYPRYLLYPLFADNRLTRYQTRFVNDMEFNEVVRILREKTNDLAGFNLEIGTGKDEFGYFMDMPLEPSRAQPQRRSSSLEPTRKITRGSPLELSIIHKYRGASIHSRHAAIRCEVTVNDAGLLDSVAMGRTIRRVVHLIPDLDSVIASKLKESKWAINASFNKMRLAEVVAATTYILMRRIDEWISPVSFQLLKNEPKFCLLCEYRRSEDNAEASLNLAIEIVNSVHASSTDDMEELKLKIASFVRKREWKVLNSTYVMEEAEHRGIPVAPSAAGEPVLGLGCLQKRMRSSTTSATGYLAVRLARDKVQTASILRQAGIPVPEQIRVRTKRDAIAAAKHLGYPVVVKPRGGNHGRGVSTKLMSEAAVADAYDAAAAESEQILVENHIIGRDYRLLVVDEQLVAASERVPGHVVGNGRDTVKALWDAYNADPRRDDHYMFKIKDDYDARRMLKDQHLTLESVPAKGQIIPLRSKADSSDLGVGLTERVHPDNRLLAINAARALQLDIAGIDFITADISRSHKESKGAVCEVNNMPSLMDLHVGPVSGTPVMVAPYIIDMLFPAPSQGRIPIIAIYDEGLDDCLSHRIAQLLQLSGYEVGLATHKGIWIGGDSISRNESANFDGVRQVLLHPSVSAAVIEVSTKSMLSEGLGFDFVDVAIIASSFSGSLSKREHSMEWDALIRKSAGALVLDNDVRVSDDLVSPKAQTKTYLIDRSRDRPGLGDIIEIKTDGTSTVTLVGSGSEVRLTVPPARDSGREIMLSIAACHGVGIAPEVIEEALKAGIDVRGSEPLLISGVPTPYGKVLLATPRNSGDVKTILRMAESWAAPQPPDIVMHMVFEGDSDLQTSLSALLQRRSIRLLGADCMIDPAADLPSLVFKEPDRKVLILTDNMEFFRKRLARVIAQPRPSGG